MASLGLLWAGSFFGTNTGKTFVELAPAGGQYTVKIRLNDTETGVAIYQGHATFDGNELIAQCPAPPAPEGLVLGDLAVRLKLNAEGQLIGQWETTIGSGGTVTLFPHDQSPRDRQGGVQLPEQIRTASRTLGALRLQKDDIAALVDIVERDFQAPRSVISYRERGTEISRYSRDVLAAGWGTLEKLEYLRINIAEPDAYGITRSVTVTLDASGQNEVRIQGVQESWVAGKAETVAGFLKSRERPFASTFRKHGLNINGIAVIVTVLLLPELSLFARFLFAGAMATFVFSLAYIHRRYIPQLRIQLTETKPGLFGRSWPQAMSWLLTIIGGLVVAVLYGWLKGEIPRPSWPLDQERPAAGATAPASAPSQ